MTENIADMGGMACVLEILGDDKQAQRKAFESNAKIWATNQIDQYRDYLLMVDVHSLNKVPCCHCSISSMMCMRLRKMTPCM